MSLYLNEMPECLLLFFTPMVYWVVRLDIAKVEQSKVIYVGLGQSAENVNFCNVYHRRDL